MDNRVLEMTLDRIGSAFDNYKTGFYTEEHAKEIIGDAVEEYFRNDREE